AQRAGTPGRRAGAGRADLQAGGRPALSFGKDGGASHRPDPAAPRLHRPARVAGPAAGADARGFGRGRSGGMRQWWRRWNVESRLGVGLVLLVLLWLAAAGP